MVYTDSEPLLVLRRDGLPVSEHLAATNSQLTAPMPGTVVAVLKQIGDTIKAGDTLMVLEAMKMEHAIHAPTDGILVDIFYDVGAQVLDGAELVALEAHPT